MTLSGHCLCGAVTWTAEGPELWACYCHCESCRRTCAAPVTAFFGVPRAGFRWTGTDPAAYASSPGVTRRFCGTCGTPMAYLTDEDPDGIHLYAALDGQHNADAISAVAHELAKALEADHPDEVISSMRKASRAGKVFVDWSQNNGSKTTVSPYSLRGRERHTTTTRRRR